MASENKASSDLTFTWLHLSDFHFREKADWQADVVLQSLIRDVVDKLPESNLAPDAVFITGDIAHSGKEGEYRTAAEFFKKLAKALGHDPKERWFLVPGNHDVDRGTLSSWEKKYREFLAEKDAVKEMGEEGFWLRFSRRQQAFFDFTLAFLGPNRAWEADRPWKTEFLEEKGIAILCLNSAWASQDDDDKGNLLLGEYQIRQALKDADEGKPLLKIGLFHHPIGHLKEFDGEEARGILCGPRGCQFLLHGHLHRTRLNFDLTPSSETYRLAAGACWQGSGMHHSVTAVQLDLAKRRGRGQVWMYSDEEGGFWTPDTRLYQGMPSGTWEFDLPETWKLSKQKTKKDGAATGPLIPPAYRRLLLDRYGNMDTIYVSETPLLFRLQKVYVPLHTQWWEPEKRKRGSKDKKAGLLGDGPRLGGEKQPERPLLDLLNIAGHGRFAVSGGAGYGKSTFVRFAALEELGRKDCRLPLLLELKDFGEFLNHHPGKDRDLLPQWASGSLGEHGLTGSLLSTRSGKGRLMWLLDGLDEIFASDTRFRAASIIGSWFSGPGKGDGLILTGRPHAFSPEALKALDLVGHQAEVRPLSEKSQELFLENWFGVLYGKDSPESARRSREKLWQCMRDHDRLGELRTNPLLLSAIATVFHQGKTLPERRADLYQQAIHVLLTRRFGAAYGGSESLVREMRSGLTIVARYMCEQGQAREIANVDFLDRLERGFHPERKATAEERLEIADLAEKLASHSGLLTMRGAPPVYQFSHLGFQEYLAACAFGEEREPLTVLLPHLEEGSWREVILLTAGHLFESGPSFLGKDFTNKLLKWSEEEKESGQSLALVLEAAAEAPFGALNEKMLGDLRERAVAALSDIRPTSRAKDRMAVGDALAKLGDPRLDPKLENRWAKIEAGSFLMGFKNLSEDFPKEWREYALPEHKVSISRDYWIGLYPVTNAEYATFMDDGGYGERTYWSDEGWTWLGLKGDALEAWFEEHRKKFDWQPGWKEYLVPGTEPKFWRDGQFNRKNQPVVGVNRFEAEAYCGWLEARLSEKLPPWFPEKPKVRLPSEAEWEYAARGSQNRPYPWGEREPQEELANYEGNRGRTTPVGMYGRGQTPEGVLDLAGNVWE